MVVTDDYPEAKVRRLIIRPNRSLSWRQSLIFLGAISVPLLLISAVLAAQGYWLVLPFAGLEMAALFACMYMVSHACRRCEVVSVSDAEVTVEKGRDRGRDADRGGPEQRISFSRGWVKVELSGETDHWYPRRLWIGASGQRVEIGEFLVDEEKTELAAQLQELLAA